jgi:hypothetical protein
VTFGVIRDPRCGFAPSSVVPAVLRVVVATCLGAGRKGVATDFPSTGPVFCFNDIISP